MKITASALIAGLLACLFANVAQAAIKTQWLVHARLRSAMAKPSGVLQIRDRRTL